MWNYNSIFYKLLQTKLGKCKNWIWMRQKDDGTMDLAKQKLYKQNSTHMSFVEYYSKFVERELYGNKTYGFE